MTDEQHDLLRDRLHRADPAPARVPVDPVDSPRARALLEATMQHTVPDEVHRDGRHPAISPEAGAPPSPRRPGTRWLVAAAVAGTLAVGAAAVAVAAGFGDGAGGKPLALSLPPGNTLSSCMAFDPTLLTAMPLAFAGSVTEVGADTVTLEVDRWYKGGDAGTVTVAVPAGSSSAALDGVDFVEGGDYLVTATDGVVNGCGFSGPSTPELQAAFDEAFG
ncbi:MAG TPA: hypothetical protein VF855_03860 [Acidimicrobiales bacterium]